MTVIDVQPGETEEQATERTRSGLPVPAPAQAEPEDLEAEISRMERLAFSEEVPKDAPLELEFGGRAGWTVTDLSSADWALSRIADLEQEMAEVDRLAEEAIGRVRMRQEALQARAKRGVQFFSGHVHSWAEQNRATLLKGGKKKSRRLIHGVISWRKAGGGLVVTDEEELLAWAQAQPVELELVRLVEAPAIAAIRKHAAAKKVCPPGMEPEPESETLTIKAELAGTELAREEE